MSHNVLPDLKLPTSSGSRERHSSLDNTAQDVKTTLSRESSSSSEGKRRRPGRVRERERERFRLSSSDTAVMVGASNKSEERKRKSMSDYLDLKAREAKEPEPEPKWKEPRDRKLSAESIRAAIQRQASSLSNWTTGHLSPSRQKSSETEKVERKKMLNKKLTPIPSIDIPSDSEAEPSEPGVSHNGKGILKKVSNVELPSLDLFQAVQREELSSANNNSPSRMVKFDMPSFDSQNSEENPTNCDNGDLRKTVEEVPVIQQDNPLDKSVQCQTGQELFDVDFWKKLNKLLEYLQKLENNNAGDHEVLDTFSLERLASEGNKWRNILRKSVSNVVRIQNTISENTRDRGQATGLSDKEQGGGEVTCPLIQFDFEDRETQTDIAKGPLEKVFVESETQTEREETGAVPAPNTEDIQVCRRSESCPNLDIILSDEPDQDFLPAPDEILTFDLDLIKYYIMSKETDIVDDFVIL